jgi:ATP-dependent protease ClpP protease subunit
MMEDRIIFWEQESTFEQILFKHTVVFESADASKDIQIYLNSPGGSFMQD